MVFTHGSPVIVQLLCLLFCIRILFHEASKPVVVFIHHLGDPVMRKASELNWCARFAAAPKDEDINAVFCTFSVLPRNPKSTYQPRCFA